MFISLLGANDTSEVEFSLCCSNVYVIQLKYLQNSKHFAGLKKIDAHLTVCDLVSCLFYLLSLFELQTLLSFTCQSKAPVCFASVKAQQTCLF